MKQKGTTAEFVANTPDGWAVDDPGAYQFLVGRDPPRPGSYLRLLKSDARSWRVLLYWVTGIVWFAVGAAAACAGMKAGWLWLALPALVVNFARLRLRWYVLVPVWIAVLAAVGAVGAADVPELAYPGLLVTFAGARLLAVMLWLFLLAARNIRQGPVLRGEIRSIGPHLRTVGFSTAYAHLSDGQSVLVSVKTGLASAVLGRYGRAEVLLLAAPDKAEGCVIAIRPLARDQTEAEADTAHE